MGMFYDLVSIQEYLDVLIKANEEWQAARDFNSKIRAIGGPVGKDIYLSDGVECFADVLGIEVSVQKFAATTNTIGVRKEFIYKGYKVFQIKEEPAGAEDD